MAVPLTGIKGSGAQGGAGVAERFQAVDAARSKDILASRKADLNGKTGVLRLLHTSKDADMKFQNADGMKHFAKGSRLDRTGDAVRTLLEKAGATKETLAEFDTYKAGRAGKGLESRQVVRFIETLKAESGGSVAEVLGKIGIRPPRPGDVLGEGAYGKVSEISYRGQKCVFKEIKEAEDSKLPAITLDASADHRPVEKMSRAEFMEAVQEYKFSDRRDFPKDVLKEVAAYVKVEENLFHPKKVTKEERAIYEKWSDKFDFSDEPAGAAPKIRLNRHGESAAAWMKGDITHVVKPSVYVVRETAPDGTRSFHAVPGGKFFKTWSTEKLTAGQSRLEIAGLVMERAKGKQLVSDADLARTGNQFRLMNKISGSEMKNVARSGLDALKQLGAHGFVHGDIKPANIMLTRQGIAKLIDIGSAVDLRERTVRHVWSPAYAAPEILQGGVSTPRTDLASLGYVLVEMLSGQQLAPPQTSYPDLLRSKLELEQRLPDLLPPEVASSELLLNLCQRLVATDPARRFPSAQAAELGEDGAASFHRELITVNLSSEYSHELQYWLEELGPIPGHPMPLGPPRPDSGQPSPRPTDAPSSGTASPQVP